MPHRMLAQQLGVPRYPLGTACALIGFLLVLSHYVVMKNMMGGKPGWLLIPSSYSPTDSRFWRNQPYLLGGITLSLIWLCIASAVDASRHGVWWPMGPFSAVFAGAAFSTLVPGHIYLVRHWNEFFLEVRGRDPVDPDRYALAPLRLPLVRETLWLFAGFALLVSMLEKMGYRPVFENEFLMAIYQHIVWGAILALVIVLWTSCSPIALLLRFVLLLLFTVILVGGTGWFLYWLATEIAPALVVLLAAMLALNFVFYHLLEARRHAS